MEGSALAEILNFFFGESSPASPARWRGYLCGAAALSLWRCLSRGMEPSSETVTLAYR